MKSSVYPLFLLSLITLSNIAFAQTTTYKISTSKNWSAVLPASCIGCTVNISAGVTLTIDESATCMNCTFNGGNISMSNESLSLLYSGSQTTTYFSGTSLTASGTASVSVNAPLSLTNTAARPSPPVMRLI
jgi:hypothetical protein